jgi:GNAT superfamily N-acetyltransferase
MRVIHFANASEISSLGGSAALPPFNPSDVAAQLADIHLCAVSENGDAQARCSLWSKHVPIYKQHRVGILGHYAAASDEAAAAVLTVAQERLRAARCTIAIGPMNGNTWRTYRFVTERGDQPPFFLEPTNPPEWPLQFENAGFSSLASYFSALNSELSRPDPRIDALEKKIANAGVVIRSANSDLRRELPKIYAVSQISFRQNFLYKEIPETEFISMYEPVLPIARPELVLIAESTGQCVGYLFAIPDLAQKARGLDVDTFIIKTVSILPQPELRGLGTLLVARAQQRGQELGFRRCIHALMFEDNVSLNISRHYASAMRKYTLYSKELTK